MTFLEVFILGFCLTRDLISLVLYLPGTVVKNTAFKVW